MEPNMLDTSSYHEPCSDADTHDDADACGWCGQRFGSHLRSRHAPPLATGISMPYDDGTSFTIHVCIGECAAEAHAAARRLRSAYRAPATVHATNGGAR